VIARRDELEATVRLLEECVVEPARQFPQGSSLMSLGRSHAGWRLSLLQGPGGEAAEGCCSGTRRTAGRPTVRLPGPSRRSASLPPQDVGDNASGARSQAQCEWIYPAASSQYRPNGTEGKPVSRRRRTRTARRSYRLRPPCGREDAAGRSGRRCSTSPPIKPSLARRLRGQLRFETIDGASRTHGDEASVIRYADSRSLTSQIGRQAERVASLDFASHISVRVLQTAGHAGEAPFGRKAK
jgi:hypothetical protein